MFKNKNLINIRAIIILLIALAFFYLSYNYLLKNYLNIETKQNKIHIKQIVKTINYSIEKVSNSLNTIAKGDGIYNNFRNNTNTLKYLNIDFIFLIDKSNNILFSQYINNENLKKTILEYLPKNKESYALIKYQNNFLFIMNKQFINNDKTLSSSRTIYAGKFIKKKNINKVFSFPNISISINEYKNRFNKFYQLNQNIKTKIVYEKDNIINYIEFFDKENKYSFTIKYIYYRDVFINGKLLLVSFFTIMMLLFLIILFYQILLNKNNKMLELKVKKKTNKLNKTLTELKKTNKELHSLATIDVLTNINNRRSYFIQTKELFKNANKQKLPFFIAIIDLDDFKKINDSYGHSTGDIVLKEFVKIVKKFIKDDIFGRIGGEEFCITFYNKDSKSVNEILENIKNACINKKIDYEGNLINFTVSIGLSDGLGYINIDQIIDSADNLLYEAKKTGKNRIIRRSSIMDKSTKYVVDSNKKIKRN